MKLGLFTSFSALCLVSAAASERRERRTLTRVSLHQEEHGRSKKAKVAHGALLHLKDQMGPSASFPSCNSKLSGSTGSGSRSRRVDGMNVMEGVCDPCTVATADLKFCEDVYDSICNPEDSSYDDDDCDFVGLGSYSYTMESTDAEATKKHYIVQPKKVNKKKVAHQALLKLRNQPKKLRMGPTTPGSTDGVSSSSSRSRSRSSRRSSRTFPSCDSNASTSMRTAGSMSRSRRVDGRTVEEDICDPCTVASADLKFCEDVYDTVCDPDDSSYDDKDCDFVGLGSYTMLSNDFEAPKMLRGMRG